MRRIRRPGENTDYGRQDLTPDWLFMIWNRLKTEPDLRTQHATYYAVSHPGEITADNFLFYWQAMRYLRIDEYRHAVNAAWFQADQADLEFMLWTWNGMHQTRWAGGAG